MTDSVAEAIEVLDVGTSDAASRGESHGELRREAIRGRVEHLLEALGRRGEGDEGVRERLARAAVPAVELLERESPELAAELAGIARGADVQVVETMGLELGDALLDRFGPARPGSTPRGGSTVLYVTGPEGPVLGLCLREPATQAALLELELEREDGSTLRVLGAAGELGCAGWSDRGRGVATTSLSTTELGVGLSRGALVRRLLAAPSVAEARGALERSPIAGGHFFMLAELGDYVGIEVSHARKVVTQLGARTAHVHTDHAFDPVMRRAEQVCADATTWRRMEVVSNRYVQLRPDDLGSVFDFLSDVDADPRGQVLRPGEIPPPESAGWAGALYVMGLGSRRARSRHGGPCADADSAPGEIT